jgi:two-component system NarL family response regulator
MPKGMIRILIVDDHAVVRFGLADMIRSQPDMLAVGEAVDGRDAIKQFKKHRPDVTLMDLRMPRLDGTGAIAEITRTAPEAKIIVLSAYDSEEDIADALAAGAHSYLVKNTPPAALVDAIRTVHRGEHRLPPAVAKRVARRRAARQTEPSQKGARPGASRKRGS